MKIIEDHRRLSKIIEDHRRSLKIIKDHWRSPKITEDHRRSLQIIVDHQKSTKIIKDHWRFSKISEDHHIFFWKLFKLYKLSSIVSYIFNTQILTIWSRSRRCIHSWRSHDFNQFKSECRDIIFDLIDIIFSDAFIFSFSLFLGHVASNQVSHHSLQSQIRTKIAHRQDIEWAIRFGNVGLLLRKWTGCSRIVEKQSNNSCRLYQRNQIFTPKSG